MVEGFPGDARGLLFVEGRAMRRDGFMNPYAQVMEWL